MTTSLELAKKRSKSKRKALIVGINKFTRLEGANLSGCVADAKDFYNTLLINGFPPTRMKLLTDEKATKANIIKGFEWLVKDAKPDDVLVYYHSGHGSQTVDVDDDEADGYDEMLIPSNFDWDDESTYLTDDDLYNYFTAKTPEGVICDVVLDTCFSGTGTRSLLKSMPIPNNGPNVRTAKFLPRPVDQQLRLNSMIPAETKVKKIGSKLLNKAQQHNTLQSACSENQVSWETANESGEVRGVFTYDYCQILRRSDGNKTRREVYQILRNALANEGAEQIPQLEVSRQEAYDQYPFRRSFEDEAIEVSN